MTELLYATQSKSDLDALVAEKADLMLIQVFDHAHDGIAIIHGDLIHYANPRLAQITGYASGELCGMSVVDDLSPPEERERHRQRIAQRALGRPLSPLFETIITRKDGASIAAEITTNSITYQGDPAILAIVRNITDKQQSQNTLAQALAAAEKYANSLALLNQMSQALNEARSEKQVFDAVGNWVSKVITADRVYIALLPRKLDDPDIDLLNIFALDGLVEPVPAGIQLPLNEVAVGQPIKTRKTVYSADNRKSHFQDIQILSQSGLLSTLSAPLVTSGRILGTLNVCSVQTNAFDEQDQRLVEQMASLIASVLDNCWLYEEAKRSSDTKSLFLSNMTHELRTPMNAVLGMTSILLDTELTEEQLDTVDTIRASGAQLLSVINDVLDFSKIEANKLELEMTAFNVKDAVEETLGLFRATAFAKNLALTCSIDEDVPKWIIQDVTRLRQILTNLLTNAIKFTDRGRVEVAITATLIQGCQYQLQVSVADTGVGIPAHKIGRLFQSFSQIDASTTRKYGGSGLGLSISKQLCELMGGEMWVQSEPAVGSNFVFTFITERTHCRRDSIQPTNNGRTKANLQSFDRSMAQTHPLKILLAEDNAVNQKVALSILTRFGYKADVAANGIEVLASLERQHYDVVLMDIHMPDMDGVEATKRIRKQIAINKQPIIIAVTANAMDQHRQEYLAAGMDDYVSKPISIAELVNALEKAAV